MRALRILGLADNGTQVVCEEPESGDQYRLPADERLNAAARGDLSRLGQLEIEMQSQLRPREIQTRVRAGASVEQIAAQAGCDPSKIERFAYPVLMERGAMADKARQAHPVIGGLPSEHTVEQLVTRTLTERGQLDGLSWDAYREDTGQWVLLLRWTAGRSENTARWAFHARSTGSTLAPYDDTAAEIVDPAPRPLRTVRDLTPVAEPAPVAAHPMLTRAAQVEQPTVQQTRPTPPAATPAVAQPPAGKVSEPAPARSKKADTPDAKAADSTRPEAKSPKKPTTRPAMPSWEDVLLGVRSSGH